MGEAVVNSEAVAGQLSARRLYGGLIVLNTGYLVLQPLFTGKIEFLMYMQATEAALFASVILVALRDTRLLHWLLLLPMAAAVNVFAIAGLQIAYWLSFPLHLMGFEGDWVMFLGLSVHSGLCAAVFGMLLQAVIQPVFMRPDTYGQLAVAGFLAYVSALIPSCFDAFGRNEFALHKLCWFTLVGLTLLAASRRDARTAAAS